MSTPNRSLMMAALVAFAPIAVHANDVYDRVEHGYADSDGVKIHYATMGEGPLVVMVHGFPDFWYSWRHQMAGLADRYKVVAIDQRGYNKSDKPEGQENYDIGYLVADIAAVIKHFGKEKAVVVGHDWGGFVAWFTAITRPDVVDKLVVLNLPHPRGFSRELANNPEQQKNSAYARNFQQPDAHEKVNGAMLAMMVAGKYPEALPRYREAFKNSDIEAMLHYYKQNYPKENAEAEAAALPPVKAPTLQIHGLKDFALHSDGLNNTWDWIDAEYTLVTFPQAGHFVQHDAADAVTRAIGAWLDQYRD